MTSPYASPAMLRNLAPLGVDWNSVPTSSGGNAPSPLANLAALTDICFIASDAIDTECFQPLRATVDLEELIGPGGDRLVVNPFGTSGVATARMQHWPITAVLGAQVSGTSLPPSWTQIASQYLWVAQASAQFLAPSGIGGSGSDGMNEIEINAGYVNWGNGRGGCRLQIAYMNGWPTCGVLPAVTVQGTFSSGSAQVSVSSTDDIVEGAPITCLSIFPGATIVTVTAVGSDTISISQPAPSSGTATIDVGYPAGVTSLNVDDVTGMAGTYPTIFDSFMTEGLSISSVTANNPVLVLPNLYATIGEGALTLASPTRYAHTGSQPASAIVSGVPSNVRQAAYYYAGAQVLQRGGTAFTMQSLPGSLATSGEAPTIGNLTAQAEEQLKNFKRIF